MALVKTDNTILSIRGRFGGVYFKTGPNGQHIQSMPRVVRYTRSPAQQGEWGPLSPFACSGIAGFSAAAYLFGLACIAAFALIWAMFAGIWWFTTKTGEKKKITGYNWYLHYAEGYPEAHRPPFWKPPPSPAVLPDYMATWRDYTFYHYRPENWPDECCAGYYYKHWDYNGKPSLKTDDGKWYVWWKDPVWVISPSLAGEPAGKTYYSTGVHMVDYYANPVTGSWTFLYLGKPPS